MGPPVSEGRQHHVLTWSEGYASYFCAVDTLSTDMSEADTAPAYGWLLYWGGSL